jgi:glycosyltransferase involved in cell wall biosynthesis
MDAFHPVEKVRSQSPTVVMLSNIQLIKDIKSAIMAADVIVNKYGFQDYKLMIYGAQDRELSYTIAMSKLISQHNLTDKVVLAGFGKPQEALKDAWLFLNSSLSEGLPLAIAEAALAGVPIVATAVGGTALVLTDPDDPEQKYGEVVPPNDPVALARAQINLLAMMGPWAKHTGEVPKRQSVPQSLILPDVLREREVEWLTRRMYEKAEYRRELGLLTRRMVLRGFHGKRYLREHEQMYWIQWHMAAMRQDPGLMEPTMASFRFGARPVLRYVKEEAEKDDNDKVEEAGPAEGEKSDGRPQRKSSIN